MQCGVEAGIDANHGGAELVALLRLRPEAEAFAEKIESGREAHKACFWEQWEAPRWARWLAAHKGHEVKVFSEYGYAFDQCSERVDCETCRTMHVCALPLDHEGPHSRVRSDRVEKPMTPVQDAQKTDG